MPRHLLQSFSSPLLGILLITLLFRLSGTTFSSSHTGVVGSSLKV